MSKEAGEELRKQGMEVRDKYESKHFTQECTLTLK
jgi:hypothetical protein